MSKTKQPRQYRSNQGRSPRQQEGSYKAIAVSFIGLCVVWMCELIYRSL